jgi:hypothetical protein
MKVTSLVVVLFFCCALGAPNRPKPSEQFEAHATVFVIIDNKTRVDGEVFWAANQPTGLELEIVRFRAQPNLDTYLLSRYDQEANYEIDGGNNKECKRHPLEGKMPEIWGWVAQADYKGRQNLHGRQLDVWEFARGHAILTLGVTAEDPNTPVFLRRNGAQVDFNALFHNWHPQAPHDTIFAVPHSCTNKTSSVVEKRCVSGSSMISRAAVWVANRVPYNQGATYQGYREDCSGYVSMAWELSKPGYTTRTLPSVSHPISKSQLKEGDVLLNRAEHVVLFGGWANSAHTEYVAYEETRPGEGTVKRNTPYPYWYSQSSFLPYRYNNIC